MMGCRFKEERTSQQLGLIAIPWRVRNNEPTGAAPYRLAAQSGILQGVTRWPIAAHSVVEIT